MKTKITCPECRYRNLREWLRLLVKKHGGALPSILADEVVALTRERVKTGSVPPEVIMEARARMWAATYENPTIEMRADVAQFLRRVRQ